MGTPHAAKPELSLEEVNHIARLSRLGLSEDELRLMQRELAHILETIRIIQSAEVTDVPPTHHPVHLSMPWREDEVIDGLNRAEALAQAPQAVNEGFAVPKVLKK